MSAPSSFLPGKTPEVIVVIGPGAIGLAIARRIGAGKHLLLADLNPAHGEAAAKTCREAGFKATATQVDIASAEAIRALAAQAEGLGEISGLVHAAGVSPAQASPRTILEVDLYGTAVILETFGALIRPGGAGLVIASQSGHRLPALSAEENRALATAPTEDLLTLPLLQAENIRDSLHAYQLSKRANALRVMAEACRWGKRGARLNTISPGIIMTPLALDELNGPRGAGYRHMIENCPAGRAGTADEIAELAAFLMGPTGAFISGSDFLMDGGVTASYFFGDLAAPQAPEAAQGVSSNHRSFS